MPSLIDRIRERLGRKKGIGTRERITGKLAEKATKCQALKITKQRQPQRDELVVFAYEEGRELGHPRTPFGREKKKFYTKKGLKPMNMYGESEGAYIPTSTYVKYLHSNIVVEMNQPDRSLYVWKTDDGYVAYTVASRRY